MDYLAHYAFGLIQGLFDDCLTSGWGIVVDKPKIYENALLFIIVYPNSGALALLEVPVGAFSLWKK